MTADYLGWRSHSSQQASQDAAGEAPRAPLVGAAAVYAPEINPVEYVWAHLEEHQIANLLVTHGWKLSLHATAALRRMRRRPRLIRACWHKAELCF